MVNKFGTFQKTAKQADCDFYAAVYGKEESQKSLGSQITIINRDCGHGSLGCQWIFSDPPMNIFFVFHVNTEQSVNLPHYGGMNKVKFMETDDGYDVTMESEKYGKTHLVEKYSDEGITHITTYKGKTHTEFSQRIIEENGLYRLEEQVNYKEYLLDSGMPEDLIDAGLKDMKFHWASTQNGFQLTTFIGGPDMKITMSGKFDEEQSISLAEGVPPLKYFITKLGIGKYKTVKKFPSGVVWDFNTTFTDGWTKTAGKNLKTGATCTASSKKYISFEGKWKTITIDNAKEIMDALGLPADMIQKALTDFGILEFEDRCPVYHWKWNSAINPLDITFKMDEEMEYFDTFANENTKIISTQSGNKLVTTTKNSYGTWITTTTFNNTFAIMKCALVGLDMPPMVLILEKM